MSTGGKLMKFSAYTRSNLCIVTRDELWTLIRLFTHLSPQFTHFLFCGAFFLSGESMFLHLQKGHYLYVKEDLAFLLLDIFRFGHLAITLNYIMSFFLMTHDYTHNSSSTVLLKAIYCLQQDLQSQTHFLVPE